MKWILSSKSSSAVQVFTLMDGNTVKEILRYNPLQQSARLSAAGRQRVFFIEDARLRNNQFLFKNEYGFTEGKLTIDHYDAESGTIEFDNRKLNYQLSTSPSPELLIYENDNITPLLTCSFSPGDEKDIHQHAGLLLGLCWYLYAPAEELLPA